MAYFEIEGIEKIMGKLESMGRKANAAVDPALQEAAKPMQNEMKRLAPYDPTNKGKHGRDAISIGGAKNLRGVRTISIGIMGADWEKHHYMYYQEFGTSHNPAHPWMQPGYESKKQEAYKIIGDKLKETLKL